MSHAQLPLRRLGADVEGALEAVSVPAYVLDRSGHIRWLNAAALNLLGDLRGQRFTRVVSTEDNMQARAAFARSIGGGPGTKDVAIDVVSARGERVRVDISSVPLRRGTRVVGIFGLAPLDRQPARATAAHPHITPRQREVLEHLARGASTEQIATSLHLSPATVRNHIRGLLRALGAHSRLEAVAAAHTAGILAN